jgi:hypothetical protein
MFLPLWFVVSLLGLFAANLAIDVWAFARRRHHDHLIPTTPRAPRG